MMINGRYYDFNGCLTERERAINSLERATEGLYPKVIPPLGRIPTQMENDLFEAVFRLTDEHGRRMTAAMLTDLATVIHLTRAIERGERNG